MNKLSLAITFAIATQVTSLEAGVFSFLTGKGRSQGNQVTTSAGSRAEAKVDKNGSIVRVGSNTAAKVSANGTVTLSKGVMLVSSGEGFLRRPPVQISTPQGDVTVRGSAIVAALPDGSVKMTVLEGHAKGALGGRDMALNPGQLMIQRHETRDAVKVDLGALAASSTLLDNSQYQLPLPATPVIRQEVVDQAQSMGATLTLSGASQSNGGQVVNAAELKMARNADAAGAGVGGTVGGTLTLTGSNNYGSSGVTTNLSMSTASISSGATLSLGHSTTVMGPLLPTTAPPSVPGTNQSSIPGLVISGSSILLNTGTAGTITNIQHVNAITGLAGNVSNLVVRGSTLTLSNGAATASSVSSINSNIQGTTNLVIAPGSTTTGQLVTTTGATLTLLGSTVISQQPANSSPTAGAGAVLAVSGGSSVNIRTNSDVYQPLDWSIPAGASFSISGSSTTALGSAVPLFDLANLMNNGGWALTLSDLNSLFSSGIIVTVGGPPSGYVAPATTTTTTPPVVP